MPSTDFLETSRAVAGDETVLRFVVPNDLVYFEGHFEGNPMLPAVAQVIALVDARARQVFGVLAAQGSRRMTRLKFQSTVRPGEAVELGLALGAPSELGERALRFRIDRLVTPETREPAASGTLVYR